MPFFAHEDIFSTYKRAENIAFHQQTLFVSPDVIPHLVEAINLRVISIFIPHDVIHQIHGDFRQITEVNTLLFFFKLPYLIAECIFWYILFFRYRKPQAFKPGDEWQLRRKPKLLSCILDA